MPGLTEDGRLYRLPDGSARALIPTERAANHASNLLQLPGGDLLCTWFAGSDEGNSDVGVWCARFDAATQAWRPPVQVSDSAGRSDQNPSLFLAPDGLLWVIFPSQVARGQGVPETFNLQHTAELRVARSSDGGRNWGPATPFGSRQGSFTRQSIQVLASGRWILPTWVCFDDDSRNGSDITVMLVSDDVGASWREVNVPDSEGRVHAQVVQPTPGLLLAFYRSRFADRVYLSTSLDDGETWSRPSPTVLPNNNSSISAAVLPDGRVTVVHNDLGFNVVGRQVYWPYERPSVTISVSDDLGRTFAHQRVVEAGDGFTGTGNLRANRRHEYPAIAVAADGLIHLSWSYQSRRCIAHAVVDTAWIDGIPDATPADCKLWT